MHDEAKAIFEYWRTLEPQYWYIQSDAIDREISDRFLSCVKSTASGIYDAWQVSPEGALALIILCDQFPRNIYRDDPRAFALDAKARAVAKRAIHNGFHKAIHGPMRQFVYMPLVHSEANQDQDQAVALFTLAGPDCAGNLLHARAHREIIRRFGRFPFRNAALGRKSTEAERAFLEGGAYGAVLRELQAG